MEKNKLNGRSRVSYEPEGLTLSQIKNNAIKKWWLFVVLAILFLGAAYFINSSSQPKYKISATVLFKNDAKVLELFDMFQNQPRAGKPSAILADQIGKIKSYSLNLETAQNLNWKYSWAKKEFFSQADLYGRDPFTLTVPPSSVQLDQLPLTIEVDSDNYFTISTKGKREINGQERVVEFTNKATFGQPFKNQYFDFVIDKKSDRTYERGEKYVLQFNNIGKVAQQYKDRLEVSQADENSNLIVIQLETEQLHRDVDYLNKLSSYYIQQGLDEKNRIANNTVRFIDNLIEGINDSLQMAGNNFTNFRSRNRTVNLGDEATRVMDQLKKLDQEQQRLNLKLEYYTNLRYYLENREDIKDLVAPSIIGVRDDELNTMVAKLNDMYTRREVLSYTVQEKNPTLIALNNEIQFTQRIIRDKVTQQIANTNMELKAVRQQLQQANAKIVRLPKTEQDLIGIKRNYDLNNELYTYLLEKRAEADIARASNSPDAQILDPADASIAELLGPKKVKNYLTALIASFIVSMLIVIASEYFSDKIKMTDEIASTLDFPITGSITENKFKSEMPVIQYPKSAVTESFRGLRINLQNHFKNHQVLAVHSYISGEGKSFVALNLALVLAISNKRVLLIDADLRRPRLHTVLKGKNAKGLGDYLNNKAHINEVIQPTFHEGLYFVSAGTIPNNPAELLNNGLITEFLDSVKEQFDYIVFDNSPVGIVSDATIVGMNADVNLFLVRLNYSMKENLEELNKVYHEGILRNVLVAVNGLKQRPGYGYYNEDRKKLVDVKA